MSWLTYGSLAVLGGAGAVYLYVRRPAQPTAAPADKPTHNDISCVQDAIVGDKLRILDADALIYELGLAPSIAHIKSNLGLSDENWNRDALPLIRNFIVFVQRLPASESHHHAGDGGLVRHTLDVAALALLASAAKSWPPNAKAEDIACLTAVWRYGILTAALLHDIGKVLTSFLIELYTEPYAKQFSVWVPDAGLMNESGRLYYRVTFPEIKTAYQVHASLGWTFFQQIVPSGARRWMGESDPKLIQTLRAYLSGHTDDNPLTEIVRKADMTSTARDLKAGSRQRFSTAKRTPLIEVVMGTLIEMLAERGAHFSIAITAGGDVFRKGDVVYLMSKNVPDFIRDYLKKHKPDMAKGFPTDNQRIFDSLLEYDAVLPSPYDEHKAITAVSVVFERGDKAVKSHQFTMLQFRLGTLYPDGNYPAEFQGTLEPLAAAPARSPQTDNSEPVTTEEIIQNQTVATVAASFMATAEDLKPAEKVSTVAETDAVFIPPPPKARPTQAAASTQPVPSGIDALLASSGLLEQAVDQDNPPDTPTEPEINPPQPKPIGKSAPAKSSKSLSLLKDLFSDPGSANEKAPPLPAEDCASVALAEIQAERDALPVSSPRPIIVKQTDSLEDIVADAVLLQPTDDDDTDTSDPRTAKPTGANKPVDLQAEGKRFWNWLASGLSDGTISVNRSDSFVHFAQEGMLMVTPAIFRAYAGGFFDKNNPACPGLLAQKGFISLKLNQRNKRSAIFSALGSKANNTFLFHCYLIPEKHLHLVIRADSRPPNNIEITLADSQTLLQPGRSKK